MFARDPAAGSLFVIWTPKSSSSTLIACMSERSYATPRGKNLENFSLLQTFQIGVNGMRKQENNSERKSEAEN